MAKKPKEDAKELIGGSANQKRPYQDKSIGRTNQLRSPRRDKARFSSNQIRLAGRQGGRLVIRTSCFGSANQKASEHLSNEPQDRSFGSVNHIFRTDHPSDESSDQPITSFGWIILRTNRRLSQSHPSVGLSSEGLSS